VAYPQGRRTGPQWRIGSDHDRCALPGTEDAGWRDGKRWFSRNTLAGCVIGDCCSGFTKWRETPRISNQCAKFRSFLDGGDQTGGDRCSGGAFCSSDRSDEPLQQTEGVIQWLWRDESYRGGFARTSSTWCNRPPIKIDPYLVPCVGKGNVPFEGFVGAFGGGIYWLLAPCMVHLLNR
jgi:hypothetical protein